MTSENATPSPGGEPHVRHRLLSRDRLIAAYNDRWGSPAVSTYALAVRTTIEDCPEIGPINTWSRLSERICRGRRDRDRNVWRKKLSRHFAPELKGPPWQTVEIVVRYVVAESEREATLGHFKRLHDAARGDRATSRGPEPSAPVTPEAGARNGSVVTAATDEPDPRARTGRGRKRHRPLGGEARPEDIARQREHAAPGGAPRRGCNPGHFPAGSAASQYLPAGPASINDAPASRRVPFRADPVWPAARADASTPAYGHRIAPSRTPTRLPSKLSGEYGRRV